MSAAPAASPAQVATRAPRRPAAERDLARAVELRPAEVFALYGIAPSTLGDYATKLPPERRPVSRFIRGQGGRKGVRLFPRAAFERWLACHDCHGAFDAAAWAAARAPRAA